MNFDVIDLFAGNGWAEGLRILGMAEVGLEWDQNACRTRAAAGHPVIRTDVALYPLWPFKDRTKGFVASPPCQGYSRAGKRLGIADVPLVHQAVTDLSKGFDTREALLASCRDKRSLLAAEALGWGAARVVNTRGARTTPGGNEFPSDQPSWALTEKTRSWVLRNGKQPGAAIRTADEPAPTVAFGNNAARVKWVLRNNTQANSSRRSLDEPAGTLFFGARGNDVSWVAERPAATVAATDHIAKPGHRNRSGGERQFEDSARITVEEASVLQSFRPDYPWQGSKTAKFLQIGNAFCPRAAAAVIGAATGMDWVTAVEREYGMPGMERAA